MPSFTVEEVVEDDGFGEVLFFKPFSDYYGFFKNNMGGAVMPRPTRGNEACFYPVVFGPRMVTISFWHQMYTIPLPWTLFVCYFSGKQWAVYGVCSLAKRPEPGKPVRSFQSVIPNTRFREVPCWGTTKKWSNTKTFPHGAIEAITFFMSTNFNTELGGYASTMGYLTGKQYSTYHGVIEDYAKVPLRSVVYRAERGTKHLKKSWQIGVGNQPITLEAWPDEEEVVPSAA